MCERDCSTPIGATPINATDRCRLPLRPPISRQRSRRGAGPQRAWVWSWTIRSSVKREARIARLRDRRTRLKSRGRSAAPFRRVRRDVEELVADIPNISARDVGHRGCPCPIGPSGGTAERVSDPRLWRDAHARRPCHRHFDGATKRERRGWSWTGFRATANIGALSTRQDAWPRRESRTPVIAK